MGTLPGGLASARSGSLRLVAAIPSSRPMFAKIHDPVHTLTSSVAAGSERMNSCSRVL